MAFFSSMHGILYSLVTEYNDGFYSAYEICDSDFETFLSENEFVKWIQKEDRENLTPFIVKKEFFDDFITILMFLLMLSP